MNQSLLIGKEVPKNLKISYWSWSNFSAAKINVTKKMDQTIMYLTGDAKLWWRIRTR